MENSSGYKEYVAGLLAGVSTVVVGHPFDTVKVKLQKHNTEANGIKYKSGLHCTTRILKTEGVWFFTSYETQSKCFLSNDEPRLFQAGSINSNFCAFVSNQALKKTFTVISYRQLFPLWQVWAICPIYLFQ
ncbi:hypothetical protein POM88_025456 [Heracleum sosnowskyi]|uniref:Mitochondrial carrier protein n=1 Tax=Heracleum sosnowskyi TaxID=360622 RepID=A0AAD8I411_9APIA|nr:hypothetical protein POM88_025456 [Heracleum sosnowskyi]